MNVSFHSSRTAFSVKMAFVVVLHAVALRAALPPWAEWRQVGPNELVVCSSERDAHGGDVRSVSVCNRPWHEPVWVGAGFALDEAHRTADVVELEVRSAHPHVQLFKVADDKGHVGVWNLAVGPQWQRIRLPLAHPHERQGGAPVNAAWIEFSFFVHSPADHGVADVKVRHVACATAVPETVNDRHWMPSRHAPPVKGFRAELTVHNIGNGTDYPGLGDERGYRMLLEISRHLNALYGSSLGISVAYAEGPWAKKWTAWMKTRGCHTASEGHVSGGLDNLARLNALQLNREGRSYRDFLPQIDGTHGEDQTSAAWISWARGMVERAGDAGAMDWRSIDYIWPCHGGYAWADGVSSRAFWPQALRGEDGGLEGPDGRVMRFADYFRLYTGLALSPAFAGFTAWADYRPPRSNETNANHVVLQDLLAHYAWIRSQNELGRTAFARSGLKMKPVVNPESIETATDIVGLGLGRFCGGACVEWWGDADCAVNTYYAGPYYANALRRKGLELIFVEESAAAGGDPYHGRPFYWDNQSTYMIDYVKGASTDATAVYNQYWQGSLERALDPSRPDHEVYASFLCSFDGFLQAKADGARKAPTDVLVIATRAIADRAIAMDRWAGGQATAARHLMRLNYNHHVAGFPLAEAFRLQDFKIIFFNPLRAPAGFSRVLAQWLEARPGRVLAVFPGHEKAFFGDGSERVPGWDGPVVGSLKGANGHAVATVRRAGKGRLVVFDRALGQGEEEEDDAQAIDTLMRRLGQKPVGVSRDDRFAALAFQAGEGRTLYALQNRGASVEVKDGEGRVWRSFQSVSRHAVGRVKCLLPAPGRYAMTDRVTGATMQTSTDSEGYATVSMEGFNMRLVEFKPVAEMK